MQARAGTADVIVDFTGGARDPNCSARQYLRPLFNGVAGENAALAAILAGDLPVIEIVDEVDGAVLDRGHPSAEIAAGLSGGLETVTARTLTMVAAILSGRPRIVPQLARPARADNGRPPTAYVARGLTISIAKEIYRLCCYAPHWHVGWRINKGAGVWQTGDLSGPRWNVLADPGNHFYADPFPSRGREEHSSSLRISITGLEKESFPRSSSTIRARSERSCPYWTSPGTSPIRS